MKTGVLTMIWGFVLDKILNKEEKEEEEKKISSLKDENRNLKREIQSMK